MFLRSILLAALVPAGFALFHDFPSYDTARNVATTSLELDEGKAISISSNAIHWRKDLYEGVKSGATVQFFKPNAWYRKIGAAKVGEDITLAGKAIAAGDWVLSIKVPGDDTSKFFIEWKKGETAVDVPLTMNAGHDVEDHLLLALTPRGGAGSKDFELKVGYGDLFGKIAGTIGAAKQ
jgi:hypothetical protein